MAPRLWDASILSAISRGVAAPLNGPLEKRHRGQIETYGHFGNAAVRDNCQLTAISLRHETGRLNAEGDDLLAVRIDGAMAAIAAFELEPRLAISNGDLAEQVRDRYW